MLFQEGKGLADGDQLDRIGSGRSDGLVLSAVRQLWLGDYSLYPSFQNHSAAAEYLGSSERAENGQDDAGNQLAACESLRG